MVLFSAKQHGWPQATAYVVHSCIISKTFIFSATSNNSAWFIDTCAFDYVARDFH